MPLAGKQETCCSSYKIAVDDPRFCELIISLEHLRYCLNPATSLSRMACYSGYDRKWRSGLMSKRRSKLNQSKPIWFVLAGVIFFFFLVAVPFCGDDVVLFVP